MNKTLFIFSFAALALSQAAVHAATGGLTGAGSSAAAPVYQAWARAYQKAAGPELTYDPVGSSAGLKKIRARETGFGASDVAPPEAELAAAGLVVFPVAISGVAPVVNLPKIADGQLKLTGDVLAKIFLGEITQWNAPEIAQLNPGVVLPAIAIKPIVRGDGSGTTYNFADYLAKVHPAWKAKHGAKSSLDWPAGFTAVKGSEAVMKAVRDTAGAIGYIDYSYVRENKLAAVQLKNADGEFTAPSMAAFRSAVGSSDWMTGSFTGTLTQMPGKASWPITMGTFALVPKIAEAGEQTATALRFLVWSFLNGDAMLQEKSFIRLPDRVQASAFKTITSIRDKAGNPIGLTVMGAANATR